MHIHPAKWSFMLNEDYEYCKKMTGKDIYAWLGKCSMGSLPFYHPIWSVSIANYQKSECERIKQLLVKITNTNDELVIRAITGNRMSKQENISLLINSMIKKISFYTEVKHKLKLPD